MDTGIGIGIAMGCECEPTSKLSLSCSSYQSYHQHADRVPGEVLIAHRYGGQFT